MTMKAKILLAYPGGEITLFNPKRAMPLQALTKKAASLASEYFTSWQWLDDGQCPAIESLAGINAMVLIVQPYSNPDTIGL